MGSFKDKMSSIFLGAGWDKRYFKALLPYQLLILVIIMNMTPQFLGISLASKLIRTEVLDV